MRTPNLFKRSTLPRQRKKLYIVPLSQAPSSTPGIILVSGEWQYSTTVSLAAQRLYLTSSGVIVYKVTGASGDRVLLLSGGNITTGAVI